MKKNLIIPLLNWDKGKRKLFFMRLGLLKLMLIFGLMSTHANVNSQTVISKLKLEKVELSEALERIEELSSYDFVFNYNDLKGYKVSVDLEETSLENCLDQVLKDVPFEYKTKGDVVVISYKEKVEPTQEQEKKELKGTVTDTDGNTLPGVSVVVKGTTIGVATDIDGNFSIQFEKENAVLVFSFVGMLSQEIIYKGQAELNVTLKEDAANLGEVVVTGYQTISKERATGSFEKISTEQLGKPSSNISERLVGMMAGVRSTVKADGSVDFEVRGQTSLYGDAKPLIVVDGFAVEDDFGSINPNDVESITVLKDAAASSIWGARSANGVIVITTKKAKKGATKVSVSSFVKFSDKLDLDYANPLASSAETIEYEKKGFESDFFGGPWGPPSFSLFSMFSGQSQAVTAMNEYKQGHISETEMNSTLARLANQNNKSQIEDYLLQVPVTQQYNVNISGGSETMQNVLSLMYENNKDYFKENKMNKFLVNYRSKIQATKWLEFDFSGMLQLNNRTNNGVSLSDIQKLAPYDLLVNSEGKYTDLSNMHYYTPALNEFVPTHLFPYSDWSYNPITEINNREKTSKDLNTRIQAGLTFKIIKGLTYNSKFQYELFTTRNKNYYNEKTFEVRKAVNESSSWNYDFNSPAVANLPLGGMLKMDGGSWDPNRQKNYIQTRAYNFRNQLNFVRTFAEKHAVNVVVGTEISDRVFETTRNPTTYGYDDDKLSVGRFPNGTDGLFSFTGQPVEYVADFEYTNSYTYDTDRYFSLYGNAAYTYDNKYTLSASVRTDASNLITDDPSYRYSPFWSAGLGWQIGKEDFMSDIDWIDRLNLRATYGFNGNVDKSTSFKPLIDINPTQNQYTNATTATIGSYGNPTLRWEKTQTIDVGLDFSLFKSKLHGAIDFYNKQSADLIVDQDIAAIHGTTHQRLNNGEMYNRGIELKVGTSLPIKGKDIVWSGSLNFAYNKNKITNFYKEDYTMSALYYGGTNSYSQGYNANTLWSLKYSGMKNVGTETNPKNTPSFYGPNGQKYDFLSWPPGGDARKYEKAEGTTVAPYILGFSNTFKIYDFDLSFVITGKFGHVFRRQSFNYPAMGSGNTLVNDMYADVVNSDPSQVVPIPENEYRYYFWGNFYPYLDYLTADASHIRFQEVNLTYSLPDRILRKIGLSSLSVYAQANNLGTILFNDYKEDPEYQRGTMKPQAAYTFGVKFNL